MLPVSLMYWKIINQLCIIQLLHKRTCFHGITYIYLSHQLGATTTKSKKIPVWVLQVQWLMIDVLATLQSDYHQQGIISKHSWRQKNHYFCLSYVDNLYRQRLQSEKNSLDTYPNLITWLKIKLSGNTLNIFIETPFIGIC